MKLSQNPRKPCSSAKLILQEIIGLTTKNANGLASVSSSSKCVYVAGCVVVVYDVGACTQSHLVVSHLLPNPLSCVAVSHNGRFVAAGESSNLSSVLIWDCDTLGLVAELKGYLYGAQCLSFSPNGEYLVSVGGYIYLWDWRKSLLLAKVKASSTCSDITSVAFSSNGKFIVTSGNKHLKYWTTRSSKVGSLAFHGKSTDNGFQKGNSFVSVISANRVNSSGSDERGVLMLMSCDMLTKISVDLKMLKRATMKINRLPGECDHRARRCLLRFFLFLILLIPSFGENKFRERKATDDELSYPEIDEDALLNTQCPRNLELRWQTEVTSSLDIVVPSFVHYLEVLEGSDGDKMPGWPAFHQSNVHSSPLLFDIDKDGVREIALATYNGEVLFFRVSGFLMSDKLEVPRRKVHKNWHVGLNPDPVDRSHPDVHDELLVQEAKEMKSSTTQPNATTTTPNVTVSMSKEFHGEASNVSSQEDQKKPENNQTESVVKPSPELHNSSLDVRANNSAANDTKAGSTENLN
ncbi:hypothetical protein Bca4012_069131 [Brassica carinata]